jgi:sugar O-acyltransferase (sialic acid O-acetyltransferase NeuD family)
VGEGDWIEQGDLICILETTKATSDVEAPIDGYVRQLHLTAGQRAQVGAVICALTESRDGPVTAGTRDRSVAEPAGGPSVEATKEAQWLATQHRVDLTRLGNDRIVTARDVRQLIPTQDQHGSPATPSATPDSARMAILGAGGHARAVVDLIRASRRDLQIVAAVDDGRDPPRDVLGVPVLGGSDKLEPLRQQGVRLAALGVGAVTDNRVRIELFHRLCQLDFLLPSLIHPNASVEPSATIGSGNQIFAGAIVGSSVSLADNTIINCGSVLSHDCRIGSHSHVAPGAVLAGGVVVGQNTLIGMGVTVYLGVTIGDHVVIANGMHVLHDVPDGTVLRASA